MRVEDINVKITIPLPINKPDRNGNIYTEEAIKKMVENFTPGLPLITGEDLGTRTGTVNNIKLDVNSAELMIDAEVFAGGT